MARGVLSGFITGGLLSTAAVAAVSVLVGPPKGPSISDTLPIASSEVQQPLQSSNGQALAEVATQTDADPAKPSASVVTAPDPEAGPDVANNSTGSANRPSVSTETNALPDPAEPGAQNTVAVSQLEPVYPNPQVRAPQAPDADATAELAETSADVPSGAAPVTVQPDLNTSALTNAPAVSEAQDPGVPSENVDVSTDQVAPDALDLPDAAKKPVIATAPAAVPAAESQPEVSRSEGTPTTDTPAEQAQAKDVVTDGALADGAITENAQAEDSTTPPESEIESAQVDTADTDTSPEVVADIVPEATRDRVSEGDTQVAQMQVPVERVGIGRPANSLLDRSDGDSLPTVAPITSDATAGAETAETAPANAAAPALSQFAVPFDNPDRRPLMSIVLVDSGQDLSKGPVGLEALQSFPYPLSFAVDAGLPDAEDRAAIYRSRGFEVLALVDLPENLTASDTEVAMTAALDTVSEAVGVMEGTEAGLQGSKEMSDQISDILTETGHGIVWQPNGLDTAQKLAAREGIASETLFRDFDSKDQSSRTIRRFLDQAAFKAGQNGAVIMVGRLRPDTISALLVWGLQDRAARVAIAPISAVLSSGQGTQ